jgi:hypothetical protein
MMPPPISAIALGALFRLTASRAVITTSPSGLKPGIWIGAAPVAITMPLRATNDSVLPSDFSTSTVCRPVSRALPITTVPPTPFTRLLTPPVSFLTMPSFQVCIFATSTLRSVTVMPMSSAWRSFCARPLA